MMSILLAPLNKDHIDDYINMEFDPDVKKYIGGVPKRPRDRYHVPIGNEEIHAIVKAETQEFIGRCGFISNDDEHELYIVISKSNWGNDYAREAVKLLLKDAPQGNIVAVIDPENSASIHIFETLGFVKSGMKICKGWENGHMKYSFRANA